MKYLLCALLIISQLTNAQGVEFEHGSDWEQIKAKAKAQNKIIFVECYMSWCHACQAMNEKVLTNDEVGTFMNKNFINLKVQMDSTNNDDAEIKSWRPFAVELIKKYKIDNYPTLFFFDQNGNVIHRDGGSAADEFVDRAKNALKPETQYYNLLGKFNSGNRDTTFLLKLSYMAEAAQDHENLHEISKEYYLSTQKDLFSKDNLEAIQTFTYNSRDTGFTLMLKNPEKVDAVLGAGVAEAKVIDIIMNEEVYPMLAGGKKPDWDAMNNSLVKKFPGRAEQVLANAKLLYYGSNKDSVNFKQMYFAYLEKFGSILSPQELDQIGGFVWHSSNDPVILKSAAQWSKRNLTIKKEAVYKITYANLLYKSGIKDEAIKWMEKALTTAADQGERDFAKDMLQKMKKGEKTWE